MADVKEAVVSEETKADAEQPTENLKPLEGKRISSIEKVRRALQEEAGSVHGVVQLQPLEGLDAIPNKISSVPPKPIELKPEELWVDRSYQRSHLSRRSLRLIHKIVENWDWTKFKSPVVTRDEQDRYLVIDGQHTSVAAATHPDIIRIPVMFVALKDVGEQAKSFIGHNMDRITVMPIDLWYARKRSNDPDVLMADRIMRNHGMTVVKAIQGSAQQWESNQTMATAEALKILDKYGQAKFTQIVSFLSKCGFSQIRADHWKFAASFLAGAEQDRLFSPDMMLKVIQAIHENDAYNEARRIHTNHKIPTYKGLLVFYKNEYKATYQIK